VNARGRHPGRTFLPAILVAALAAAPESAPDHATSKAYNRALGVECAHCHTDNPADRSKPTFDFALRMERMAAGLNRGPLLDLGGVTCWTCHRGQSIPARLPAEQWRSVNAAHAADFAGAGQGVDLSMSVYSASLGVDCGHCHTAANWKDASARTHALVRNVMLPIFDVIPRYFEGSPRQPRTQCFMCHHGQTDIPREPRP
jgi:hypothetical protein